MEKCKAQRTRPCARTDWRADQTLATILPDRLPLLCLDVFDTLLLRRCGSPDRVFAHTATLAREAGLLAHSVTDDAFIVMRREAERIARLRTGHRTTLDDIYQAFGLPDTEGDALRQLEFAAERHMLVANPFLVDLLHEMGRCAVPVVLVSDMYLPAPLLEELLRGAGLCRGQDYADLYVSCDHGLSKAGGALFRRVLDDHPGVMPNMVLHIGDDPVTDVAGALAVGLQTIHYRLPAAFAETSRLEALLSPTPQGPLAAARGLAARSVPGTGEEAFWGTYGATVLGPVAVHYATWLVRQAEALGIRRVAPLLREGELLGQLMALEAERLGVALDISPLAVSRIALYFPSLAGFDEAEFRKLAAELHFTLRDAVTLFALDALPDTLKPHADRPLVDVLGEEFGPNAAIFRSARDLLLSEASQARIRARAAEARRDLIDYVTGVLGEPGPVLLIDIGARGTMFERLSRIPEIGERYDLHGAVFYATREALHRSLRGVRIHSHMPLTASAFDRAQLVYRSPQFMELLLNGEAETTVGYRRDDSGQVWPIHQPNAIDEAQRRALAACRAGIFAYRSRWAELAGHGDSPWDREVDPDRLLTILHRSVHLPTTDEAARIGTLRFDVNNGSPIRVLLCDRRAQDRVAALCEGTPPDLWLSLALQTRPSEVPWPQGSLASLSPGHVESLISGSQGGFNHRNICRQLVHMVGSAGVRRVLLCAAGGMGGMGPAFLAVAREAGLECAGYADLLVNGDGAGKGMGKGMEIGLESVPRQDCRDVVVASIGYGQAILAGLRRGIAEDGRPLRCWWYDGARFRCDQLEAKTAS